MNTKLNQLGERKQDMRKFLTINEAFEDIIFMNNTSISNINELKDVIEYYVILSTDYEMTNNYIDEKLKDENYGNLKPSTVIKSTDKFMYTHMRTMLLQERRANILERLRQNYGTEIKELYNYILEHGSIDMCET